MEFVALEEEIKDNSIMKNLLNVLSIFTIIIIAYSCEEDSIIPQRSIPKTIAISKDLIQQSRSDRSPKDYIRGEFDGKVLYLSTISDAYYYDETICGGLFVNNANTLDQINLIRQNKEGSIQIAIYFSQSKIFTRQFPYSVPDENHEQGESIEINLMNLKKLGVSEQGLSDDDFSFIGTTINKSLKIQVTKFVDNTLEGTFEGYLTSNTGSTIIVKNGGFRIKIKVVNSDNK